MLKHSCRKNRLQPGPVTQYANKIIVKTTVKNSHSIYQHFMPLKHVIIHDLYNLWQAGSTRFWTWTQVRDLDTSPVLKDLDSGLLIRTWTRPS